MKTIPASIPVRTPRKAGAEASEYSILISSFSFNHNERPASLPVRTPRKAGPSGPTGGITFNHNERPAAIAVRTTRKAGPDFGILLGSNHNEKPATV